jgi:NSS family neurotransmitter:Na+ symporter
MTLRPTFTTRSAAILAMVGVAIGLGNFWRFPYLVGRFGGTAFVLFYLLLVVIVGIPALMAEWALGRETQRGPVGAFARAGVPFGRHIGWFFFAVVLAASAYYANAVGWVLCFAVAEAVRVAGVSFDPSAVLPPETGFSATSFLLQLLCTGAIIGGSTFVLVRGLRGGIEKASRVLVPALFVVLLLVIVRSLTMPGAAQGVRWYLFKFSPADLTGSVMVAALGQMVFSLALGGTFMVVYGSYLVGGHDLRRMAAVTATADTAAGLLAGLAIFPAVFALGLEPASGPGLIFGTLPRVFDAMPAGPLFALLLYGGLLAGALLSVIAALEVVIAGLTDNTRLGRTAAALLVAAVVMVLALPTMINLDIFVRWDLTFGSGMQTLGALLAVLAFGWSLDRAAALRQLAVNGDAPRMLYLWIRFVVPGCILLVGVWWLLTEVLRVIEIV